MYRKLTETVDIGSPRVDIDLDKMSTSERLIIQDFMKIVQWRSGKLTSSKTPYGYRFGADRLGLSDKDARKALGVFFSSIGTTSLAALVSRVTGNSWGNAVLPMSPEKRAIVRARPRSQRNADRVSTGMFSLLGGISAMPTVLLTHKFFVKISPELAKFLDVITLLGYGSLRTWAVKRAI